MDWQPCDFGRCQIRAFATSNGTQMCHILFSGKLDLSNGSTSPSTACGHSKNIFARKLISYVYIGGIYIYRTHTVFDRNNSCIAWNKQQQEMQIKKTDKVAEIYHTLLGNRNLAVEGSAEHWVFEFSQILSEELRSFLKDDKENVMTTFSKIFPFNKAAFTQT